MKPLFAICAAAVALAVPAAAQKPTNVVTIALYSYGYAPAPIVLKAGRPVTMVFTNRSGKGHSFKSQGFFRSSRVLSGRVHDGEIHLKRGETASVTLVPTRGTYRVHCSHFLHDQLGMHATLYVQ